MWHDPFLACLTPALVAASSIAAASLAVRASSFSQMMCLPAFAVSMHGSACVSFGPPLSKS
jgi:hypothetical protein